MTSPLGLFKNLCFDFMIRTNILIFAEVIRCQLYCYLCWCLPSARVVFMLSTNGVCPPHHMCGVITRQLKMVNEVVTDSIKHRKILRLYRKC